MRLRWGCRPQVGRCHRQGSSPGVCRLHSVHSGRAPASRRPPMRASVLPGLLLRPALCHMVCVRCGRLHCHAVLVSGRLIRTTKDSPASGFRCCGRSSDTGSRLKRLSRLLTCIGHPQARGSASTGRGALTPGNATSSAPGFAPKTPPCSGAHPSRHAPIIARSNTSKVVGDRTSTQARMYH